MWHSSFRPSGLQGTTYAENKARAALEGVGDASLGEWVEVGPTAVHVRRRVTAAEQEILGPAIDIRGTAEARARVQASREWLPRQLREFAENEAGLGS